MLGLMYKKYIRFKKGMCEGPSLKGLQAPSCFIYLFRRQGEGEIHDAEREYARIFIDGAVQRSPMHGIGAGLERARQFHLPKEAFGLVNGEQPYGQLFRGGQDLGFFESASGKRDVPFGEVHAA